MRPLIIAALLVLSACQKEAPKQEAAQGAQRGSASATQDNAVPAPKLDRSHAGQPAPTTEFEDPDGEPVSLAAFEGKPLLVNLWATWCAPCVAEMPTLDALARARNGKLQVLAVSQDMNGREKVDAFFKEHKLTTLEPYLDPKLDVMGELKAESLPTTILFDDKGRELWRVTGTEDWQSARAAALINEAFRPR
jgi:thiol-disulfide isomerase/thioredoxin